MVLSHGDEKLKSDQLKPDTKKSESKSDQKPVQKSAEVKKPEQDKPGSTSKPVDTAPVVTPKPVPEPPVPNSEPVVSTTSESVTEAPSAHTMLPPPPETPSVIVPDANKVQAEKPEFGGTLNATTGQAEADRAEELDRERQDNTQALEHGAVRTDTDQAGLDAIEAARRAIEEVAESSTDPANNPTQSVGAQELPAVHEPALPELPALPAMDSVPSPDGQAGHMQAQTSVQNSASEAVVEEPSPVDAFMQPHQDQPQAPNSQTVPFSAPGAAPSPDMPPLPPLPPMPGGTSGSAMPPLPPMPGQSTDPTASFQPDLGPAFMQGVPQSQNSWSQAADDMAAKQADKEANRQAKLDQMGAQYDAAVDQNLINQGKPPINNPNDHSTFPLPPTS